LNKSIPYKRPEFNNGNATSVKLENGGNLIGKNSIGENFLRIAYLERRELIGTSALQTEPMKWRLNVRFQDGTTYRQE
jgi:hypothetical protein